VRRDRATAALVICAAACTPYLSTIDDYFVRDDFGVVQLLASKPWSYFPTWFHTSWMDFIWGFTPDEVRPFPALSYQLTALGGASSPILHHAFNILMHALNGLLVAWIARAAAGVGSRAATAAGLVFVLLPVHTETVAWITGRVDSMPAFFYLASFAAYVRWRASESTAHRYYLLSLVLFFVALFTKQNTITMVATLGAYDLLVRDRGRLDIGRSVRAYVPFVALTAGYLWLRYLLFGQVAREGSLGADALASFGMLVERHLVHVVTGRSYESPMLMWLLFAALSAGAATFARGRLRELLCFGPVWWLIGVAPVAVAGYSSPRHVYLAAIAWALVLAIQLDALLAAVPPARTRRVTVVAAVIVLGFYGVLLERSVREWNVIAAVSRKAVGDAHAAALAAPAGGLVVLGAPARSWEWALPFAVRPPFAPSDPTGRVTIISPRALSCCAPQWFDETRSALRRWSSGPARDSVVALRWNEQTGDLYRAESPDKPELPVLFRSLLDVARPEDLDAIIRRILEELTR
jgi:hypothetical protein